MNLSECSPGSGERFSKILSSNFLENSKKIKVFHVGPSDFPLDFLENPHTNGWSPFGGLGAPTGCIFCEFWALGSSLGALGGQSGPKTAGLN